MIALTKPARGEKNLAHSGRIGKQFKAVERLGIAALRLPPPA